MGTCSRERLCNVTVCFVKKKFCIARAENKQIVFLEQTKLKIIIG